MSRTDRMFEIIQLLRRASTPITARVLADALEVATRTIYRDIAALQAQRVPVEGEAGIGYILRPGYDLPPLAFTDEEAQALTLGLSLLRRTADEGLNAAADRAFDKIASVLPEVLQDGRLAASGWHAMPVTAVDPQTIRRAIHAETAVAILYRDVSGVVTRRTVLPVAMIYYIEAQVMAAWCELRSDFRHFRLDRIDALSQTEHSFAAEAAQLHANWAALHNAV